MLGSCGSGLGPRFCPGAEGIRVMVMRMPTGPPEGSPECVEMAGKERESVSGHLGPPAGAPAAPETPTCLPDTTPHPTRAACTADLQLALESLDPRTLRLLWRQRELEIQALRWAVQNGKDTRLCHILEEVAGIPPNRSSHSQEKFLQNQVQKLTLELKEQKERAQWEKEHLEERLLQTTRTLQEVEAELQNLQKSCLLQLARSSWVGRMLRSQTGSVEVSLSPKSSCPRLPSLALPLSSGASAGVPWPAWKPALLRLPLELWAPAGRNQEASKHSRRSAPFQVWGEGTRSAKKPPRASSGREPVPLLSSRGCATLLLSPKGEVLSEHRIPRRETPAPRVFDDGTDLSIDRFPLPEVGPRADTCKPPRPPRPLRKGRVREPRVSRRRPGTRGLLPPMSSGKLFHAREGPARPETPGIPAPQHLPTIPGDPTLPSPPAEAGLGLEDRRLQKEQRVRVCRKRVDRSCPLVALSVQSTAESRFGFRFLSCLPVTADTCRGA
ncbi:PREDICTED: lamin tail domain-containing protein 2 [Rhinopithecus bieti]|uniref:lamin tail domain-containing protein 2 n=1 Tax=Rhinopithecus bieti TaxID=61621 RepID=UPI00083C504C|nr:PREDICTED: lamin tail domain-containing protein 2 [Rhinopithecus bieti]